MTHLICRLTAKNRDQLRNPTLGNRVWAYLYLTLLARQGTANRKRSLIFATALFQLHTGLSSIPVMPVVLSNGDTKTCNRLKARTTHQPVIHNCRAFSSVLNDRKQGNRRHDADFADRPTDTCSLHAVYFMSCILLRRKWQFGPFASNKLIELIDWKLRSHSGVGPWSNERRKTIMSLYNRFLKKHFLNFFI